MLASGALAPSDMVWKEGWPQWQQVSSVAELSGVAGPVQTIAVQPAPFSPQPAQMSYAQPYGQTGQSHNGFAIAGFVLSLTFPLLGLIFSWLALNGMKKSGNQEGHGLAVAGLVISLIVLGIGVLFGCLYFVVCLGAMAAAGGA